MKTNSRLKIKAKITLAVDVILDDPAELENIIRHETEYLAEPTSAKGCIIIKRVDDYQKCGTAKEVDSYGHPLSK